MEGVELMRRYAGWKTQWFGSATTRTPLGPGFKGKPARYRSRGNDDAQDPEGNPWAESHTPTVAGAGGELLEGPSMAAIDLPWSGDRKTLRNTPNTPVTGYMTSCIIRYGVRGYGSWARGKSLAVELIWWTLSRRVIECLPHDSRGAAARWRILRRSAIDAEAAPGARPHAGRNGVETKISKRVLEALESGPSSTCRSGCSAAAS